MNTLKEVGELVRKPLLRQLEEILTTQEALAILLSCYDLTDYLSGITNAILVSKSVKVPLEDIIASRLCGTSGKYMVKQFMLGKGFEKEFFNNVAFNSDDSIPMVIWAINKRLRANKEL